MSRADVASLAATKRREIEKAAREMEERRREGEEKRRWYNQPSAAADYAYWCKVALWSLDEVVALSLGRDPRKVRWGRGAGGVQSLVQISPFARQYEDRKRIVEAAFSAGELRASTSPWAVAIWAKTKGMLISPEWERALDELGQPYSDLCQAAGDLEEEFLATIDKLENELATLRKSAGGRPREWDWDGEISDMAFDIMREEGVPSPKNHDPKWRSNADLARAVQEKCMLKYREEPAFRTVRGKVPAWISKHKASLT